MGNYCFLFCLVPPFNSIPHTNIQFWMSPKCRWRKNFITCSSSHTYIDNKMRVLSEITVEAQWGLQIELLFSWLGNEWRAYSFFFVYHMIFEIHATKLNFNRFKGKLLPQITYQIHMLMSQESANRIFRAYGNKTHFIYILFD